MKNTELIRAIGLTTNQSEWQAFDEIGVRFVSLLWPYGNKEAIKIRITSNRVRLDDNVRKIDLIGKRKSL